jgi:hypothetical protein
MREPTLDGPSAYLTIQFLEWLSERPRTLWRHHGRLANILPAVVDLGRCVIGGVRSSRSGKISRETGHHYPARAIPSS